MHAEFKRLTTALSSAACAVSLLIGFGTSTALAQRFEYTSGGPKCGSTGYGGVQPVSTGGYIAVGETSSDQAGNCVDMNVYVVRTEADGSLAWSRSYDIGGYDHGFRIREVQYDPTGQGGFIITGYTEKTHCGNSDLLLLRIDPCGNQLWANTYGDKDAYELGWDVVEAATQGDAALGINQGDFIAAGITTRTQTGQYDGYLVRVDGSSGQLIWGKTYDGPESGQDFFQAVDETLFGNQGSTGDIIAAGGSSSYGTNSIDGWIVRVDGSNGEITGGLQGTAAYGREGRDEFWSIQEMRSGQCQDGLVVAVGTSSDSKRRGDVYMVQTYGHPCELRNDLLIGDLGPLMDEGYGVREIPFNTPTSNVGDLIVTGTMTAPKGKGHGREDVFLVKVRACSLNVTNPAMLYGGNRFDDGWSVSPVLDERNPDCTTNGFIVAGGTTSLAPNAPTPHLYLIKTDDELNDECKNIEYEVQEARYSEPRCGDPIIDELKDECQNESRSECQYWHYRICLDAELDCRIEPCDCSKNLLKPSLPEAPATGSSVLSLNSYPNPIKAGGTIVLEYTLKSDAPMTLTISDLAGRTIRSEKLSASAGTGTYSVSTEGWSSGTYMMNLTIDGHAASTRIVVME